MVWLQRQRRDWRDSFSIIAPFLANRACFAPTNHAIGPGLEKPDVTVIKLQASAAAAGWALGTNTTN
jgi:hypothetical protein